MTHRTFQVLLLLVYSYQIFAHDYIFAVQWGESICRSNPGTCRRENVRPKTWTIHGLWAPEDLPRKGVPFDVSALGADLPTKLNEVWPSIYGLTNKEFWQHEWNKHGKQAIMDTSSGIHSQADFFRLAVTMLEELNLYSIFERCRIVPREVTYSTQAAIVDCLQGVGINTDQFQLIWLKQGSDMLSEVRICFDGTNILAERRRKNCVERPPKFWPKELQYPPKVDGTTTTSIRTTPTSTGKTTTSVRTTPTSTGTTPTSTRKTTTSIRTTPTSTRTTPSSMRTTPTSTRKTPTSVRTTPASTRKTPTSIRTTPTSTRKTPTNTGKTPTSVRTTTTSIGTTPESTGKTTTNTGKTTTITWKTPNSTGKTPTSTRKTPTSTRKTPTSIRTSTTSIRTTPSSTGTTTTSSGTTTTSIGTTPESTRKTPTSTGKTPTSTGKTPTSTRKTTTSVRTTPTSTRKTLTSVRTTPTSTGTTTTPKPKKSFKKFYISSSIVLIVGVVSATVVYFLPQIRVLF